jgi:hypothetical protein
MTVNVNPFGRGIIRPFQRDGKGDFANAKGIDVLKSDIGESLGIIGPTADKPGELPWDGARGSRLNALRHRKVHSEMVRADAEQMTAGVLRRYYSTIRVGPVGVQSNSNGTLTVNVTFTPLGYTNGQLESVIVPAGREK